MAALCAVVLSALASVGLGLQVQDDPVMHNVTICNAYADKKPLSVYTLTNKAKLTEEPLAYKMCKMISLELAEGERFDFKLGGLSVGTFKATGLPYTTTNLLLVPYHKGNGTMSAWFASHSFSLEDRAQVAVIDTYAGYCQGKIKIQPGSAVSKKAKSVVAENGDAYSLVAGKYQIIMEDYKGKKVQAFTLDAASSAKYVVMRVGDEAAGLEQELVVSSSDGNEGSGSFRASLGIFAVAAVAASLAAAVV